MARRARRACRSSSTSGCSSSENRQVARRSKAANPRSSGPRKESNNRAPCPSKRRERAAPISGANSDGHAPCGDGRRGGQRPSRSRCSVERPRLWASGARSTWVAGSKGYPRITVTHLYRPIRRQSLGMPVGQLQTKPELCSEKRVSAFDGPRRRRTVRPPRAAQRLVAERSDHA